MRKGPPIAVAQRPATPLAGGVYTPANGSFIGNGMATPPRPNLHLR